MWGFGYLQQYIQQDELLRFLLLYRHKKEKALLISAKKSSFANIIMVILLKLLTAQASEIAGTSAVESAVSIEDGNIIKGIAIALI